MTKINKRGEYVPPTPEEIALEIEFSRAHNLAYGLCDCKYKENCHVPRQFSRTMFPNMKCQFYDMFEADKRMRKE